MRVPIVLMAALCVFITYSYGQTTEHRFKIIDKLTQEPISGATVKTSKNDTHKTDELGKCTIITTDIDTLTISCAGFKSRVFPVNTGSGVIELEQDVQKLKEIVVTAGRTSQSRREAPVAISTVNTQMLQDTKPISLDQVLNKTSGVFMVNLGNEQHQMSIRQPMSTKSLYLYLEDGIPIRTTGLYNHNALLEMNMVSAKQIEVIRGPASAMYGAEAIGGAINVITLTPPALSTGHVNIQGNTNGYKRTDIQYGNTVGKAGFLFSGYYANRTNGQLEHSDFDKSAFTLKGNYIFNNKTSAVNTISYSNYYSDMFGALDSTHFAGKDFSSLYNFTFRKVSAFRLKSQLNRFWNSFAETRASFVYRQNSIQQNPSYKIRNDYKRISKETYRGDPLKAHGEINNSSFNTYAFFLQHNQKIDKLNSKITGGLSIDISPSSYISNYIKIDKNPKGYFTRYSKTDSTLSDYATGITNLASYINYNADIVTGLKLVAALRYDFYHYNFRNHLPPSSFSGSPSTKNIFERFTPKLGLTYNYKDLGFYANYSQGFVPPQISELFQGVKVPYLQPQTFYNYETGGWMEFSNGKFSADWSLYKMIGSNEIISVLTEDGTIQNQNSGKTNHLGLEYGINFKPSPVWTFRLSASNSRHTFINYVEKGVNYNGKVMSGAPAFISNAEISFVPGFIRGLRTSIEWQHQGNYWMDNANTKKYKGFDVINVRAGYKLHQFEVWMSVLNSTNQYYSVFASKSASRSNYNLGEPRTFNSGIAYYLGKR